MTIKQKRALAARLVPFAPVQGIERAKPERMNRRLRGFLRRNRLSLRITRAATQREALSLYLWARSGRDRIGDAEWDRCVRAMFLSL